VSYVLVIEASGFICRLVRASLDKTGFDVRGCKNFKAATKAIEDEAPSLILVDFELPGRLEVDKACHLLKNSPSCKEIPLLLASTRSEDMERTIRRARADHCLRKPFSPRALITWMNEHEIFCEEQPKVAPDPEPEATPTAPSPKEQPKAAPGLYLLVDSSTTLLDLLQAKVVREHCSIVAAGSAQEAGTILKAIVPQAIFIDIELPDLTGDAACAFLKQIPAYSKIPIYLMLPESRDDALHLLKHSKADGILRKPFTPQQFVLFLNEHGFVAMEGTLALEAILEPGPAKEIPPEAEDVKTIPAAPAFEPVSLASVEPLEEINELPHLDEPQEDTPWKPFVVLADPDMDETPLPVPGDDTRVAMPADFASLSKPRKLASDRKATDGDEAMAYYLGVRLYSGPIEARVEACLEIGRQELAEALPLLTSIIDREDTDLFAEACWAIGQIGDDRAIESLLRVLDRREPFLRLKAIEALGAIGSEKAVAPLIGVLSDDDEAYRIAVARSLGAIGGDDAKSTLELLADSDCENLAKAAKEQLAILQKRS